MLQTIHDKISGWVAKVLLGVLVLVFVFWGIELHSLNGSTSAAAEVNGAEISLQSLQSNWQQRQIQLQQAFKGQLPEEFKKQQQEQLLTQMIRSQLMVNRAKDQGYRVSDAEIIKQLNSIESLKQDGKFSREKYAAALLQQGMSEPQFEAQLRTDLETRQLQNGVMGTTFMTAGELQRARALLAEQREVDYLVAPIKSYLSKVQINDADIQKWYDDNKAGYLTDESVDLQYVELNLADVAATVQVDDAALRAHYEQIKDRFVAPERRKARHILIKTDKDLDDAAARKQAEDVFAKAKSGADFSALAKQYSKDTGSAVNGGDLGWAGRGMFVGPFEDALFAMQVGEIRGPVKSEFGYHIIRLDEVEGGNGKTFEQARSEVEADYKAERARTQFYDQTQKLADSAFAKLTELDSVAKEFNTQVKTIANFTRRGAGEFAGNSAVIDAAFAANVLEKGENSPLVTLGDEHALVLRITNHNLPQQKPLADVKSQIVATLTERAAKAAAEQQTNDVLKQLQSGTLSWAGVAKVLSAPVGKKTLGRTADGVDNGILKAAFTIPKTQVSTATPAFRSAALSNGDYALVMVSAVVPGNAASSADMNALREERLNRVGAAELSSYIQQLERSAKITRNPKAFE